MPGLKRLSGLDVIKVFKRFGFNTVSQKGSHVKLKRIKDGLPQTLTIPNHKELDTGTLRAIINQASRYIKLESLKKEFYSD
jgi:predicted RNA binding protein YcfA (HicA-like mRNA interferase family)